MKQKLVRKTKYCEVYETTKTHFILKYKGKNYEKDAKVKILNKNSAFYNKIGTMEAIHITDACANDIIPDILVYFSGCQDWFKPEQLQLV